jgi:hypothetical protein
MFFLSIALFYFINDNLCSHEKINEKDIQIIRKSLELDKKSSKPHLIFLVFNLFFMLIVAFFDSIAHENRKLSYFRKL